jgi:RNA polymerase sigma-70 factor (ECF subfamily)
MAEFPATRASLLIRLRHAHDTEAWTLFVDLYGPLIYGYARKQGLQDADAADLCQEVLRAVANAVGRLEYDPQIGLFRNWLFTIVRHKLSNWLQSQGLRGSGDSETQRMLEQTPSTRDQASEWESEWQRRQFAWACEQVRRGVSDVTWQAFWKTAVDGMPGKQVAAELGLSVAAVYHARGRVLARLKEMVASVQET